MSTETKNNRVSLHICTKDRPTELALLLQSLRTQIYEDWDLLIIDESQNPITNSGFLMKIINRIKLENHRVKIIHNKYSLGVCQARNMAIDNDTFNNKFTARLDDDSILDDSCLKELYITLNTTKYDLVGGIILNISYPKIIRAKTPKIINEHIIKNGKLIENKDECAFAYDKTKIVPTHQFRTYCMYNSKLHDNIRYPTHLSNVGFREEGFFSFKAILNGYKLAINTRVVAWHMQCEIGGVRDEKYSEKVASDDKLFREWIAKKYKQHGNFLTKYNKEVLK